MSAMKRLLTRQMRDAEPASRHNRPTQKRDREKPTGEHPADCLCRACETEDKTS